MELNFFFKTTKTFFLSVFLENTVLPRTLVPLTKLQTSEVSEPGTLKQKHRFIAPALLIQIIFLISMGKVFVCL